LAGNSLGGWVALELAARGRALSVIGVCPAGGWEPDSPEEQMVARFFRRSQRLMHYFGPFLPFVARHATLRRNALRDVVADGRKVPSAEALALFEGARKCTIITDVLGLVGSGETFDPGPIDCPVRILYGSKDRVLGWPNHYSRMRRMLRNADCMRRMLKNADWVRLDGLGHVPMWDSPDTVASAILEHTRRALGQPDIEPTRSL